MTKEEIISQKLAAYDDAFDFYMDRGRMPDGVPSDDLLGGFMQQAINENPQLNSQDPVWKDIMKEEILRFIEAMLKLFEPVEEQYRQEKNLIQVFAKGNIDKKRKLWPKVYSTVKQQFKPEEVNIDGYIQQFKDFDPESVFGPLVKDWDTACDKLPVSKKTKPTGNRAFGSMGIQTIKKGRRYRKCSIVILRC